MTPQDLRHHYPALHHNPLFSTHPLHWAHLHYHSCFSHYYSPHHFSTHFIALPFRHSITLHCLLFSLHHSLIKLRVSLPLLSFAWLLSFNTALRHSLRCSFGHIKAPSISCLIYFFFVHSVYASHKYLTFPFTLLPPFCLFIELLSPLHCPLRPINIPLGSNTFCTSLLPPLPSLHFTNTPPLWS